jgi:hypothetical protein
MPSRVLIAHLRPRRRSPDDEDGDGRRIDEHRGSTTLYEVVLGDRIIVPVAVPGVGRPGDDPTRPDVRRDGRR